MNITNPSELQNTVWQLKGRYPMLSTRTVGQSVSGRPLYCLEVGRPSAARMLYVAGFSGTDAVSSGILMTFLERLLRGITYDTTVGGIRARELIRRQTVAVIPLVNPDGREIVAKKQRATEAADGRLQRLCHDLSLWQANARGIELSRNFDYDFARRQTEEKKQGIYGPSAYGFSGSHPFSEPETTALRQYCDSCRVRQAVCLYPGEGRVMWRITKADNCKTQQMAHLLALAAGYEVEAPVGPVTESGFRNWFVSRYNAPAFDVHMRINAHPDLPPCRYGPMEELLSLAAVL